MCLEIWRTIRMKEEFLNLYNEELSYLRNQGEDFAKAYPKIASRLRLGQGGVEDPMVGRLLESFAFLTARLDYKMKHNTDFITKSIINILYPHYHLPIPAFSTCQFQPNTQLEAAYTIPLGTAISVNASDGEACLFTTCYPVTVLPMQLSKVEYKRELSITPKKTPVKLVKSSLCFNLKTNKSDIKIASVKPNALRFFIRAESYQSNLIYELLMNHLKEIVLNFKNANGKTISIPTSAIQPVGFSDEESILPYPSHSFSGYRLLTEYFVYPEKFFYFDLIGLDQYISENMSDEVEIHCLFDQANVELEKIISLESLALGCTPIVNLFEQVGEPIKIDHQISEYHVIPDAHRSQESIEVYQVKSVDISSDAHFDDMSCTPYFGHKFKSLNYKKQLYWFLNRKYCWELGGHHISGSEVFMSFSELGEMNQLSDHIIVTPKLLCSNRDKTLQLVLGRDKSDFSFWQTNHEVIENIRCIKPMTDPVYRDKTKKNDIDLVGHVFINQLCFAGAEENLNVLKDVLALYSSENDYDNNLIKFGLLEVNTKQVTERHPVNLKQGFCRGIEYTLTIDEKYFTDNNAYLFGRVLSEFLTKSCSINSFVKFILMSKQRGEIARWKPKLGVRPTC